MGVIERSATGQAVINKPVVIAWMATNRVDMVGPVDENSFIDQPKTSQNGD